jgi:hypothetical protein
MLRLTVQTVRASNTAMMVSIGTSTLVLKLARQAAWIFSI